MSAAAAGTSRPHDPNGEICFTGGHGIYLTDSHGRQYIDFVSGYSANNFGHCHPKLVATVQRAIAKIGHVVGLRTDARQRLESSLVQLLPAPEQWRVWLATTGARAVEIAWKIAIAHRPGKLVHFDLGFHGRSIATSEISATSKLPIFDDSLSLQLPFPRCTRCPLRLSPDNCHADCMDEAFARLEVQSSEVAGVIVEPLIGARGFYAAPDVFFKRLRELCTRHEIVLIADEVQTGLGRLGSPMASIAQGWTPDLIVIGKCLGGGIVPISAVVGRSSLMNLLPPGIESETFAGSPFACEMAMTVLELLDEPQILERAQCLGSNIVTQLKPSFEEVRESVKLYSSGATVVCEFVGMSAQNNAVRFAAACRDAGIIVHLTGEFHDRVALIPPLIMTDSEIGLACERLNEAIKSVFCSTLSI